MQEEKRTGESRRRKMVLVDVGGALDAAFGAAGQATPEEWRPGEKKDNDEGDQQG